MVERYLAMSPDGRKTTMVCATAEAARRAAVLLALQREPDFPLAEAQVAGLWRSLNNAGWRVKEMVSGRYVENVAACDSREARD